MAESSESICGAMAGDAGDARATDVGVTGAGASAGAGN